MTTRVGISVTSDACSVIVMRGNRVRWSGRVLREPSAPAARAVVELLARGPVRSSRARVAIALGASSCQLKRLHGLPSSLRNDVAARVVRENAASFFLRTSPRLVTTGLERGDDGSAWCAALDGTLVQEIVDAVRAAGLTPVTFVAEPLATAAALPAGSHCVTDGDIAVDFTTTDRRAFSRIQRRILVASDPPSSHKLDHLASPLRPLGEDARFYVSAFGAAICRRDRALAWRPPADSGITLRWLRVRLTLAAAALACSLGAALVAPGARASVTVTSIRPRIASRRAAAAEAASVEGGLSRVTQTLDRIDRFASSGSNVPLLLAELSATLPESTALLSLRIDTVEVSLSVLTPRAADVASALANVEGVVSPRIVGSVMRDASTRATLERAMIRFRRRRQ